MDEGHGNPFVSLEQMSTLPLVAVAEFLALLAVDAISLCLAHARQRRLETNSTIIIHLQCQRLLLPFLPSPWIPSFAGPAPTSRRLRALR